MKPLDNVTENTLYSANSEQIQSALLKDTLGKRQKINSANKQCSRLKDTINSSKTDS
jgi:hypothetical protein